VAQGLRILAPSQQRGHLNFSGPAGPEVGTDQNSTDMNVPA